MAKADVARAVLVQPVGAYGDDNSYLLDALEQSPERFAGVCMVDPRGPEPIARVRDAVSNRGAAGIRLFAIRDPAGESVDSADYLPLWTEAVNLAIPVVVTIWTHQFAALHNVLERHDVTVVVDHCGFPDFAAGSVGWDAVLSLADCPTLAMKVTPHVMDAYRSAGGRAEQLMDQLVAEFGSERVVWGSDFPQTHDRSYVELVDEGRQACSSLSPKARGNVLGRNAERLWWHRCCLATVSGD